jgi:Ca2+-binding RTX toxin-like protein
VRRDIWSQRRLGFRLLVGFRLIVAAGVSHGLGLGRQRGLCEIVSPGQANIVVSSPFAGPTGGTVMSLAAARKKYKSSCLSGKGPKFAVVGTNGPNRISAGKQAERILGLGGNDRISAKNGADCIDGGAGNDRISVGNGNDRVFGGPGNDTITAGSGRDSIWGGAGKDRITVGKGRDHLYGGPGNDRLYDPGKVAYVNGGSGRNVAYVSASAMKYARKHGCQTVRRIRARA